MRLLIVEDNAGMRAMIRRVMDNPKAEFFECSDGLEAVQAFERIQPDFVLMDIEMKPVDGITATRQIKKTHPEARIIIVTNYGDARTREAARMAGAHGFVTKDNLLEVRALVQAAS